MEANFEASKETLKGITNFYEKRIHDSADANKELLAELNTHMNKLVAVNNKIWSDLMHQTTAETNAAEKTTTTTAKTAVQEPAKKLHTAKH